MCRPIENAVVLVAAPKEPVKISRQGVPAGTEWPPPVVLGALDADVMELVEDRDKLIHRWVKDAGLRKADWKHYTFRLVQIEVSEGVATNLEEIEL